MTHRKKKTKIKLLLFNKFIVLTGNFIFTLARYFPLYLIYAGYLTLRTGWSSIQHLGVADL